MNKRKQFWMGFMLVMLLVLSGIVWVFATTPLEFALEILGSLAVALFLSTLFIGGIYMMIDAKVSK